MKKGNIREDHLYRINVFPIILPSLRERREDIPLLADPFLKKHAKKLKRPVAGLTSQALDLLSRYDWPGNVRELENEIERALTLAGREGKIKAEYLSDEINISSEKRFASKEIDGTLPHVTARIEWQMIIELRKTHSDRSQTAHILGLTRQGWLNKIVRYKCEL